VFIDACSGGGVSLKIAFLSKTVVAVYTHQALSETGFLL